VNTYSPTGDTKAGTLIATDRYGNKYYENLEEELPCIFPWGWARRMEAHD